MTGATTPERYLDRLAELITSVRHGEPITLARCASATGLSLHAARTVLESLARRDVLVRRPDGAFLPRRIADELVEV